MRWRRAPWPVVAFVAVLIAWLSVQTNFGEQLEHGMADIGAALLRAEIESDVVIVGIDAKSLAELREWPWPRRHHAALINKLAQAAPQQVFIDIDFSASTDPVDDQLLQAAIANWDGGPIILPAFFQYASSASDKLVLTEPFVGLREHVSIASVNLAPSADGMVRTVPRAWNIDGRILPSVAIQMNGRPANAGEKTWIDYTIDPASFRVLSFSDIIANRVSAEYYADKTVFVGATAIELGDMVPVPLYQSLPGVVVQAMAYESLRLNNHHVLGGRIYWPVVAIFTLLLCFFFCRQSWQRNLIFAAASLATVAAAALYLYVYHDLIVSVVPLTVATVTAYLLATLRSLEAETLRAIRYLVGYRKRNALLKSVVQSSSDCIVCIDESGDIRMANPAATRLFDCELSALISKTVFDFVPALRAEGTATQKERLDQLCDSMLECSAVKFDGEDFPVELSVSRVRLKDEKLYTAIVRDITERVAQQRQLQFQATHDPLTTLPNRPAMAAHLDASLGSQNADSPVALMMIDLDRFKEVNDTLGHNVGDYVLYEVARRMAEVAGDRGFMARVGGDEFTLVVDGFDDLESISRLSKDLANCLREPIDTCGIAIDVGLSIGIALFPKDARDAETLFKFADVAMYAAKRSGTDFEYYDSANDQNTVRKLSIVTQLRKAIDFDLLELHYQPKVNLVTGRADSVEALMRWEDPTLGVVRPDEFIELAETTDLIGPLSTWTLSRAIGQAVAWRDEGLDLRVAVNLSSRMLQDVGFPARLAALIDHTGVDPQRIELEITESAMMIDPQRALEVIQALSDLGVMISVDDYGTGYSSLAYLRDLPVYALKLDKSFVMDMQQHAGNRVIVESTVDMAHALNLKIVAEGVETAADAEILRKCGYDYAQGYLYSAALPAADLAGWVESHNATAHQKSSIASSDSEAMTVAMVRTAK